MSEHDHWETIYGAKAPQDLSWYRPHLDRSLKFIDQAPDAAIIDVGGGASTLVDDPLTRGYTRNAPNKGRTPVCTTT